MENLFRVSASSRSTSVAGAIAGSIREGNTVALQAIGAGSVNQAVKAIAIARGFLAGEQIEIVCTPEFVVLDVDGCERTAVRFNVAKPGSTFPAAKAWVPVAVLPVASNPSPGETEPESL
jgi:stage V sporulation protein S